MASHVLNIKTMPRALVKHVENWTWAPQQDETIGSTYHFFRTERLSQVISIGFESSVLVDECFSEDYTTTSPHFAKLDAFYEQVCSRICPGAAKWDPERPLMFANLDADLLDEEFDVGSHQTLLYHTKWLVREDQTDAFLRVLEDTEGMESGGLFLIELGGIDKSAPKAGDDFDSKLNRALYPLCDQGAKFYPINFGKTQSSPGPLELRAA
jgi:hypothetical protein